MSLDILIANLRGSYLPTCEAAADEIDKMRVEIAQLRADLAVSRGETDVCARAIDASEAALTEARRVLRLVDKQARRECPVCFSPGWTHKEGCALAAVLAQEGGHDAA